MPSLFKIKNPFALKTKNVKNETIKKVAQLCQEWEEYLLKLSKFSTSAKRLMKSYKSIKTENELQKYKNDLNKLVDNYSNCKMPSGDYKLTELFNFTKDSESPEYIIPIPTEKKEEKA